MDKYFSFSEHPVTSFYGENCFTMEKMKKYLSPSAFSQLEQVNQGKRFLNSELAQEVATAMKNWALEKGATHFTHWFQPLTGLTAEKHNSFIHPEENGTIIMDFSKNELIKGEGDASSFPSGGLRATFEARGYTTWDSSSPAFIKEVNGAKVLYIPTAFFSFNESALDKKVPLLKSNQYLEKQTLRILHVLGHEKVQHIKINVGPEQEYFLVDRKFYDSRPDLRLCGRTILGNLACKGQELNDHYYGTINERVTSFMKELNIELWKLGISSKTQHKEAAPNQFELATVFEKANLAIDHNQILMDLIQSIALHHGMVALLHEKPFNGVNGSGKHNNWSISTDEGQNLFSPGENVQDNQLFLLMLTSFIKAADLYSPILQASTTNSSNQHRLGGQEAPPSIISIYLGEKLTSILDNITSDNICEDNIEECKDSFKLGIYALPKLPKDLTDRNRTSPLAFTGNKFEFRMPGSSQSLADSTTVLNAIMAKALSESADRLENAEDINLELHSIIRENYLNHKRIIFNGDGYNNTWIQEAKLRKLPILENPIDSIVQYSSKESIALFESENIFSKQELESRTTINLQTYSKQINIEATMMIEMIQKGIIPAVTTFLNTFTSSIINQKKLFLPSTKQTQIAIFLSQELESTIGLTQSLHSALSIAHAKNSDPLSEAKYYQQEINPLLEEIRVHVDKLEIYTDKNLWPYPSYDNLLFKL